MGLCCIQSGLFALGHHTASALPGPLPALHKMLGQSQAIHRATELRNVPRAHLATGQAEALPIYRSGTKGRSITGNNDYHYLLCLKQLDYYYYCV
jgi:hypothetical protein